ncbi:MAG: exopolysaccharide biosynthesis protein, partial [Pseudomonadota bacterium]
MSTKEIPASQLLKELVEKTKNQEVVSFGEIDEFLSERGFAILLILFAFPMAIPLPYPPGFTTILGLPLLILSFQMIIGFKKPYLPKWIATKTIKTSHLAFAIEKTSKYFAKAEVLLKPRLL